jgi:hypothetical protein
MKVRVKALRNCKVERAYRCVGEEFDCEQHLAIAHLAPDGLVEILKAAAPKATPKAETPRGDAPKARQHFKPIQAVRKKEKDE